MLDPYGGVVVCDSLLHHSVLEALADEATRHYNGAEHQATDNDDHAEGRGGHPARSLWSAAAGPAQDRLYHSPDLARQLSMLTGCRVAASGGRGTYSYYLGGDYLSLHRDVLTCDISMITVLSDTAEHDTESGALRVYPSRNHEPLSSIRRSGHGGQQVKVRPGQTALLLGGIVAHEVLPVAPGTQRVISVMCFGIGSR